MPGDLGPSSARNLFDLGLFVAFATAIFILLGWYVTHLQAGGVQVVGAGVNAERGESIFWDTGPVKGTCGSCHSVGERGNMKRCPNQGASDVGPPIGERAAERAKERAEKTGKPYTPTDYLVESIADPSAFVVEGFPDKLMPLVYTGQIDLEPEDVMSVVAYLQSLGGEVDLPAIAESMSRYGQAILAKSAASEPEVRRIDLPYPEWEVLEPEQFAEYQPLSDKDRRKFLKESLDEDQREMLADIEEEWAEAGREVFSALRCWQCHTISGEDFGAIDAGKVGPDLTTIGSIQTREYIMESVLNPNALIVPPIKDHAEDGRSKMPGYLDLISTKDLLPLVVYLSGLDGTQSAAAEEQDDDDTEEPDEETEEQDNDEPENGEEL